MSHCQQVPQARLHKHVSLFCCDKTRSLASYELFIQWLDDRCVVDRASKYACFVTSWCRYKETGRNMACLSMTPVPGLQRLHCCIHISLCSCQPVPVSVYAWSLKRSPQTSVLTLSVMFAFCLAQWRVEAIGPLIIKKYGYIYNPILLETIQ